jgi:hypothetical protein
VPPHANAPPCQNVYRPRRPADTVLYQVVAQHLETYLYLARQGGLDFDAVPEPVEREFRKYLECGILAYGFARARCDECGHSFLIAFSCKGRLCPSCNARRMAETAAHLVDHVFPRLPVRQWVVSFPKWLRYFLKKDPAVLSAALGIVLRIIEQSVRAGCPGAGPNARMGAVVFIHQFGSSLNEHIHFHIVVIDGVFEPSDNDAGVVFFEAMALDESTITEVQATIRRRVLKAFVRRGLLNPDERQTLEQWEHGGGFSVDAQVRIEGWDRQALERLLRYCARPPFALERLEEVDAQQIIYHLPKPTPGGQTTRTLTPLELIGLIAQLIPRPRTHRHRYFGVLAPNATLRQAVTALACASESNANTESETSTPDHRVDPQETQNPEENSETSSRSCAHYLWAMLLARIFEVFPLTCPHCGGSMRLMAFITDSSSIKRLLNHIGEPSTPPPITRPRGPPEWDSDDTFGLEDPSQEGDGNVDPEPEYEYDQRVSW